MSVCPHGDNSTPTGRILMKFDLFASFRKSVEKIQISLKSDKNKGYFTWNVFTFMTISHWILLRIRNVLDKSCREKENAHCISNNFFSDNRTVYEIMSKNMVETEGRQITSQYGAYALQAVWARLHARTRMHTPTHPGTHTRTHAQTNKYVILIAFPQQQWFREHASVLRSTYIASPVFFIQTRCKTWSGGNVITWCYAVTCHSVFNLLPPVSSN
jgi:hypothetical protein